MDDNVQSEPPQIALPAIRVAPLGELRAYVISEDELNELEQGSPASQHLNFALALLASGLSFLTTLVTTQITSTRTFVVFVILTVVFLLVGVILFSNWYRMRGSSKGLAQRIRERMPPALGIRED
jgi:ABC-type branched-subunit amino acid transport system permease subunit